jgi:hypothetical protein
LVLYLEGSDCSLDWVYKIATTSALRFYAGATAGGVDARHHAALKCGACNKLSQPVGLGFSALCFSIQLRLAYDVLGKLEIH